MKNNVVIVVFDVESEAYQGFNDLLKLPSGAGYTVPEAVLLKNKNNNIEVVDGFGLPQGGEDASTGIVIGSLVGVLGGPIGVLLGAAVGAVAGDASDANRAVDSASIVAVVASKLYEGETAIAAFVNEEEPAFDAVFANYKTTIVRYDAADIAAEVDRLRELEKAAGEQLVEQVEAEEEAEREKRREERRQKIQQDFDEYVAATNRQMHDVSPM